jgi:acyl-CoA thioester hydrolase
MLNQQLLLYTKTFAIRWHDLDAFNHVNHTLYLVYMQECRIDWLAAHGIAMNSQKIGPVIGEIQCKYIRPITFPATIAVELYFCYQEGRRLYFEHIIRDSANPELIYTTAAITVVWVDLSTGKSILPPAEYNHILHAPVNN